MRGRSFIGGCAVVLIVGAVRVDAHSQSHPPPPVRAPALDPLTSLPNQSLPAREERRTGERVNDASISASVKARLMADAVLGGFAINVDTESRIVYLSGEVETGEQMRHAERLAKQVRGVKRVENNLRVDNQARRDPPVL